MKEALNNWYSNLAPWFLEHGIKILLILGVGFIINKLMQKVIEKAVRIAVVPDKFISREAERKREDTLIRIIGWSATIVIWLMIMLMILQEFGIPIGPILAGAGIIGLAFGFGGQYLIRDIISGFFIILENQYRIGDVISIDPVSGVVEDISLRMTKLRDMNGTVHHIPHGEIKIVSNLSKDFSRINMDIGVGYNTKIDHVAEVVNRVGKELAEDPQWKSKIIRTPAFLRVQDFADSAIIIKIFGETQPLTQWEVAGELRRRIKTAFEKENIEIPFPQRVIHQADRN